MPLNLQNSNWSDKMDNPDEKRILKIIDELKTQNLIDPPRKIKSKNMPGAFKASVITSNTISFNPTLSTKLNDDMI